MWRFVVWQVDPAFRKVAILSYLGSNSPVVFFFIIFYFFIARPRREGSTIPWNFGRHLPKDTASHSTRIESSPRRLCDTKIPQQGHCQHKSLKVFAATEFSRIFSCRQQRECLKTVQNAGTVGPCNLESTLTLTLLSEWEYSTEVSSNLPTHGQVVTFPHSSSVRFGLCSFQSLIAPRYRDRKFKPLRRATGNLDKRLSFLCILVFSALEDILQRRVCGHLHVYDYALIKLFSFHA